MEHDILGSVGLFLRLDSVRRTLGSTTRAFLKRVDHKDGGLRVVLEGGVLLGFGEGAVGYGLLDLELVEVGELALPLSPGGVALVDALRVACDLASRAVGSLWLLRRAFSVLNGASLRSFLTRGLVLG